MTTLTNTQTLPLAEYLLWRLTQSTTPSSLEMAFVADFGITVSRVFDDEQWVVDPEQQAITGRIAGHNLHMTRRDVASTGRLFWCVQTPDTGVEPPIMRALSPAPGDVMQGQLVAYVVEVLMDHPLDEATIDYDTLLSMRAQLRRRPSMVLIPDEPIAAFRHMCCTVYGPSFENNPVWTVAYDDFLGLDGRQYRRALLTITATSEIFQLYVDRGVGWILMSGIVTDDPVGVVVLPRRTESYGRFDELVLALDQLRRDRDPIATDFAVRS